jgi:hypothetical protein
MNRGGRPVDPIWLEIFGDAGAKSNEKSNCVRCGNLITHKGRASTAQSHRSNCRGLLPIT